MIAEGPFGLRYGSGCVVAGKTVLTAAHVVAGADALRIRDVRKREYPATADAAFIGDPDGPGPDLALLRADGLPGEGLPAMPLARAVRDAPATAVIERCHALGYPVFAETRLSSGAAAARDVIQATGFIAPLSKLTRGLLSMVVSSQPTPRAGESPWSGMSGGPVVADQRLLGVVSEHGLPEGASALTVVPLTALEADPQRPRWGPGVTDPGSWWRQLGVEGVQDLDPLPRNEAPTECRSAYLAQVERIAPVELRGRDAELAELEDFCAGPDSGHYRWLRAPAWAGKSALLSWFVLHPPPGVRVVSFFVTARFAGQDDRVAFADAVLEQLLALLGQSAPVLLTDTTRDAHLLTKLGEAAALCRARGERLVLALDGLDEDRSADGDSIAALLPVRPVAGMRVVVAGRLNPPLPADVVEDHPLRNPATVRILESSSYALLTRNTTQQEVKRLLANPVDRQLLGFVASAGGGLTARDLAELTDLLPWQVEERLDAVAGRTFSTREGLWQQREGYVLGHEELQNDALALFGSEEVDRYRGQLHEWVKAYRDGGWPEDTPDFALHGYFRLLRTAGSVKQMIELVIDSARHARLLERSGAESAAMAELATVQDAIQSADALDLMALATVAVHRDVMARRNRNIPVELPGLWAQLGAYARAEALAQSIVDPEQRAAALEAVADATAPTVAASEEQQSSGPSLPPLPSHVRRAEEPHDDAVVRDDVAILIAVARSRKGVDRLTLLEAAEATAYTARDPDLRAELWNDLSTVRGIDHRQEHPVSEHAFPQPDVEGRAIPVDHVAGRSDVTGRGDPVERVVERMLDRGDIDHAEAVIRTARSWFSSTQPLLSWIERVTLAGDPDRAERFTDTLDGWYEKDVAQDRLVDAAVEGGFLDDAERIAQKLRTEGRGPKALLKVARAVCRRHGDGSGRALIVKILEAEPPGEISAHAQDAMVDSLALLAEIGCLDEAMTRAAELNDASTQLRVLLALAWAALNAGDEATADALAVRTLRQARASDVGYAGEPLAEAVGLATRVGRTDEALAAAQSLAATYARSMVLDRIRGEVLKAGDLPKAEAITDLIPDPRVRDQRQEEFVRAHLLAGDPWAALEAVQRTVDVYEYQRDRLVMDVVQASLDTGDYLRAATLVDAVHDENLRAMLWLMVGQAAVASATPVQARKVLEAWETAMRTAPDPAWRAKTLAEAAWAVLPSADIGRTSMLTTAAEAAAHTPHHAPSRAAALIDVGAVVAVAGDTDRADRLFQEAARCVAIPCTWAEHLAVRALATADRGDLDTARAQVRALGHLTRQIAGEHDQVRAIQTQVATALTLGDLDQATDAAERIGHPDQRALALVDVARARAAAGQTTRAIEAALRVDPPDRQADALSEVARLAATQGEFDIAEEAARAITVRGGRSPALVALAWEAARAGDFARAENVVASIVDPGWHALGLEAARARHCAPPNNLKDSGVAPDASAQDADQTGTESTPPPVEERDNLTADPSRQAQQLLARADADPESDKAAALVAEALRLGPCPPALPTLARIAPKAAMAAADTLLLLLGQSPKG
ncbi:serine protease [Streptomyces sp. NBC_00647]|uniref:trypsin-like peptidase domain-containing protein n=1 Tax=Streptomyces sp. NBC_00647 TaxID=2975796 RepID=UPI00324F7DC5